MAVIFTKGCNFRCGYCHNPTLVLPELLNQSPDIGEEEIFKFLKMRKYWLDGVVVTVGEPTIHNDLSSFLCKIKDAGFPVKLDTNGSYSKVLEEVIKNGLVDFVAMDIKTIFDPEKYKAVTGTAADNIIERVRHSLNILRDSQVAYQLWTTVYPEYHSTEIISTLTEMFEKENYALQEFRAGDIINSYK